MPESQKTNSKPNVEPTGASSATPTESLGSATYEIIRQRLQTHGAALRDAMAQLDARRQEVFGSVEYKLLQADRIITAHNCVPRDMVQLGSGRFLFGFNVQFGLKKEIELGDVFAIYERDEATGSFKEATLDVLNDPRFVTDFKRLYNVYEKTAFRKFAIREGHLYIKFGIGAGVNDLAVFKWTFDDGRLKYVDGRAEADYRRVAFPPQHEFRWFTPDRESYRYGDYPHVSIQDRVFVECVAGDLTIKVEDNTASGEGIYAEPVEDQFQKVDDAEIAYAIIGHLIILKIRPYKEPAARYFIFNEKQQSVVRADSIGQSCALLPEDHGLIFPDGYYLATGDLKLYESHAKDMILERVVHSPNGEDSLYSFYNRVTGEFILMAYRLIAQKVEDRITCNGFSLFPTGHLVLFRAENEPQKHHLIQLRQTPFYQPGFEPAGQKDAFLYQVGNKEVVRCLAECQEALTLIRKDQPYAELYADLFKLCGAILDAHPWCAGKEGFSLAAALHQVRETADKAVDEFDKVRQLQREAHRAVADARKRCAERFDNLRRTSFNSLNDYVGHLSALRRIRGDLITLKELRYVALDEVNTLEQQVIEQSDRLSSAGVKFLLQPESLDPYRQKAAQFLASVETVSKVAEGRQLEKDVLGAGGELEMLIEIVNSLQIEDATETTRIIDAITAVYSTLNQVKAALKKHLQSLVATEGAAQFNAQLKLLSQAAASYLDLCDTPSKCEEYLNRISVQIEELEGAFADFGEYTVQLAERRTELYEAFEQRKVALVEQRNRKAAALMTAAERILKVIANRLATFKSLEEINTYMASDLMIAKVRETIDQLLALDDSVKADDLQGRLKSVQQEAVRQLKDRQELFAGGRDTIQLGRHHFNINTQPLDLTIVNRDGVQHLHLTSTKYFEPVTDDAFLATRDVWDMEVVSENPRVYRAEYLAWQLLKAIEHRQPSDNGNIPSPADALMLNDADRLALVQQFMANRYQEGYTKGIHDLDAALIVHALLETHAALMLARYHPAVRACAIVFWRRFCPDDARKLWTARLKGFAARNKLFPGDPVRQDYIHALQELIAGFISDTGLYPSDFAGPAGEYLFHELIGADTVAVSREADRLMSGFHQHLTAKGGEQTFRNARKSLEAHPVSDLELVRDWVRGFLLDQPDAAPYLDEVAALLFCGAEVKRDVVNVASRRVIDGLKGSHPVIDGAQYTFDYLEFRQRLEQFERDVVPRYQQYHALKQQFTDRERARLRLDELKAKVLTTFVRNQLIDRVYLPLIGDNLAKQIGAAGETKRTDLMGLLLIISPPGYGKTTLLEYLANRLGLIWVKINGPSLGHGVTSLDPQEAPNAAAREEIHKLNLALEMGDNVLICVDDIQHTNPEFLQKFISLCDAQRKIEGVWRGHTRTYDLRGRKVVVVMAGNPYTESGQKFKIPDMLTNRADTYNLGDIIGGNADYFKASYIENAVTSNPVIAPLANKSQIDVRAFIRMAETGDKSTDSFEGSYSAQEVEDILAIMKKLVAVREIVLRVNQEYIHSAGQSDEFRTEPPFKLQGSYRNMNRLAEKLVPIMNDDELRGVILDHYRNEAQTLTTGAEANLLKFKEITGRLTPEEQTRWDEIKRTFRRNQLTRGADENDPVSRVVAQMAGFQAGLESIQQTIAAGLTQKPAAPTIALNLEPLEKGLAAFRREVSQSIAAAQSGSMADKLDRINHELEMLHSTLSTLKDLAARQRDHLIKARELLDTRAKQGVVEIDLTQEMLANEQKFLEHFHQVLAQRQPPKPEIQKGETTP